MIPAVSAVPATVAAGAAIIVGSGAASSSTTPAIIAAAAAVIAALLGVLNRRHIQQVHVLVNSQLTKVVSRLDGMTAERDNLKETVRVQAEAAERAEPPA